MNWLSATTRIGVSRGTDCNRSRPTRECLGPVSSRATYADVSDITDFHGRRNRNPEHSTNTSRTLHGPSNP